MKPSVQFSHSVVSDSVWLYGLQHARLPCPSPTLGVCANSRPSSRWCHPTISSSAIIAMIHFQISCSSCQMGLLSYQVKSRASSSPSPPPCSPPAHLDLTLLAKGTHVEHFATDSSPILEWLCEVWVLMQLAVSAQINYKLLRLGPRSHMPSVITPSSLTHNTNLGTQKDPVSTRQWNCLAGVMAWRDIRA